MSTSTLDLDYYLEDLFPEEAGMNHEPVVTLQNVDHLFIEYLESGRQFATKEERRGFEKGVAEMLQLFEEYDEAALADFYAYDDGYCEYLKEAYRDEAIEQYRQEHEDE